MTEPVRTFYVRLGKRIEEHRRAHGWSQTQLGEQMTPPVTRACVSSLELGTRRVHAHVLADLSQIFGVPADKLLPSNDATQRSAPAKQQLKRELKQELPDELATKLFSQITQARRGSS